MFAESLDLNGGSIEHGSEQKKLVAFTTVLSGMIVLV